MAVVDQRVDQKVVSRTESLAYKRPLPSSLSVEL
ncbi:MAG: hypothetical protein ACJAVI_002025 [Candidatus Azotimanducaceae bacterium]|jgi:hypothetical protein